MRLIFLKRVTSVERVFVDVSDGVMVDDDDILVMQHSVERNEIGISMSDKTSDTTAILWGVE